MIGASSRSGASIQKATNGPSFGADAKLLPAAPADVTGWSRSLALYQESVAVAEQVLNAAAHTDDEAATALRAQHTASIALFATPAPNIAALAFKLDILAADLRDFEPDDEMIARVVADAHRLAHSEMAA